MTELQSIHNPRLQEIRKAARAGRPLADGLVVAEGPHLLEDALESEWTVVEILATEAAQDRFAGLLDGATGKITRVSERALASLSTTDTSQGVMILLRERRWEWNDLFQRVPLVVLLDAIQDPGNVGTVIRSAEAFGATGVVFGEGSVRVSNGKLLRAAAGSLFRMPFIENAKAGEVRAQLRAHGVRLYALAAEGSAELSKANLREGCALAVGNEGAGLSRELADGAESVRIPTQRVESLNAGVACSIALFEAARQRGQK